MEQITSEEYNKLIDEVIAKDLPDEETLIKMLEVASKYKLYE